MTAPTRAVLTGATLLVCLAAAVLFGFWLGGRETTKPSGPAKPPPPAVMTKPGKEETLNVLKLTPEAEQRLGIRTIVLERPRKVERVRTYGGEVTVPPGRTISVAAPLSGTLKSPPGGVPRPGKRLEKGNPVLVFLPLLTPEARTTLATSRVDAEGQVKNAKILVDAAKVALDLAKRLLKEEAGSKRAVDEAQARYDVAVKTLEAAEARSALLTKLAGDADSGTATPLTLTFPQDGYLRTLLAVETETVPAGAPLFEVVDDSEVWIRVPVYVGELAELQSKRDAEVRGLVAAASVKPRLAPWVQAPPAANAAAATVDLFYALDNQDHALQPGMKVAVTLPLRDEEDSLVLPWSAIVHDIYGGTWVYENTAPQEYVRRGVEVRYVQGDTAVLRRGPRPGARIVVEAAAELFGVEYGFGK
jgi:RND family efflux transporter MFP subunit